ncbi:MAG: hypothetical protein HOY71_04255 [Nonomuraea sp.]|nr:hypothetical protein [Nonomuraea sp.]
MTEKSIKRVEEALDEGDKPDPSDADRVADAETAPPPKAVPLQHLEGDTREQIRRQVLWDGALATSDLEDLIPPEARDSA